jgi:uncharacterized protein (TIRG00374 family)
MEGLGAALSEVPLWALAWVAGVFLIQQFLRAWRQQLLVQAVVPDSTYRGNLSVLCMSFFCINTFPARLGELVRPPLLSQQENVPLGVGFSVVFLERIIDLVFVLTTLLAVLLFLGPESGAVQVRGIEVDFSSIATGMALGVVLPALALLVFLSLAPRKGLAFLMGSLRLFGRILPKRFGSGLEATLQGFSISFLEGVGAIRDPRRMLSVLGLTAITWVITGFLYVGLANGFEALAGEVRWAEGMGILVITMLATAIPSLPGFAGVYEGAVMAAFVLMGIGENPEVLGLAFGLLVHWVTYATQSATAFYFFFKDGVRVGDLWAQIRRSQTA